MEKARLFVVDDHPVIFQGLKALLNQDSRYEVCGYAQNEAEALEQIEQERPDLAIVDISLKEGVSGLDLMQKLSGLYPEMRIIALSMHDESVYSERAIRAGAHGYVMKSELVNTLVRAIDQVLAGEMYLSGNVASRIIRKLSSAHKGDLGMDVTEQLTKREFEVFSLIGEGYRTREIASKLFLSPKTVETYRMRIRDKLGLEDSAGLVRYAVIWNRERS